MFSKAKRIIKKQKETILKLKNVIREQSEKINELESELKKTETEQSQGTETLEDLVYQEIGKLKATNKEETKDKKKKEQDFLRIR